MQFEIFHPIFHYTTNVKVKVFSSCTKLDARILFCGKQILKEFLTYEIQGNVKSYILKIEINPHASNNQKAVLIQQQETACFS